MLFHNSHILKLSIRQNPSCERLALSQLRSKEHTWILNLHLKFSIKVSQHGRINKGLFDQFTQYYNIYMYMLPCIIYNALMSQWRKCIGILLKSLLSFILRSSYFVWIYIYMCVLYIFILEFTGSDLCRNRFYIQSTNTSQNVHSFLYTTSWMHKSDNLVFVALMYVVVFGQVKKKDTHMGKST